MNYKEYERAVLELFKIDWPSPAFVVRHNVKLRGGKTKRLRQIDVAVYERGATVPFLLAEAKMHTRVIDANKAGTTIALVQDIGGTTTIMVSTSGFSEAAANHLSCEEIGFLKLTISEAKALNWIPVIQKRFAIDGEFKLISGEFVEALRNANAEPFQEEILPYEEWLAVIETGLSHFPNTTIKILHAIATEHIDAAYRFNAIQILYEAEAIDRPMLERMFLTEIDQDTIEIIEAYLEDFTRCCE